MRGRKHTPEGHFSTENQRRPGSSGGHLGGICVDPCPLSELLGRNRGSKTHRPFVGAPYGGQAREVPRQLKCTKYRCFCIPRSSVPRDRLTLAAIWGSDKRAVTYLAADSSHFFKICRFSPDFQISCHLPNALPKPISPQSRIRALTAVAETSEVESRRRHQLRRPLPRWRFLALSVSDSPAYRRA